jgi:SMODS domain-containing protein
METLDTQFAGALKRIKLSEDKVARAKKAHEDVRDVLDADKTLKGYGSTTILIGSYGRDVSIQPGHDVDVLCRLPDFDADPETLWEAVRKPLKEHYKDRVDDTGAHAISVAFGDEFSVDMVGGTPSRSGHWQIPAQDDQGDRTQWDETDPERLGELSTKRNDTPLVGTQGAYKPTVKLVRQIRAAHATNKRPNGLYVEMLTYRAFEQGVSENTFAEILTSTLESIATHLESGLIVDDPALERPFDPAPTADELAAAAKIFREKATAARAALGLEKCPAAAAWRQILGKNGNGWVFPLPDDCDDKGNVIKSITDISALGPQEARGFAAS